mmetsp:Transcript_38011/g.100716  ORF Transcript_38011/g.100716 Transcript_38011/m.100716 type:complete len:271 (+) Transcript_38011:698-1510(+)
MTAPSVFSSASESDATWPGSGPTAISPRPPHVGHCCLPTPMKPEPFTVPAPLQSGHWLSRDPMGNVYWNLKFVMPSKILAALFLECLPAKALTLSETAAEALPPTPTMLNPWVSFHPRHTWAENPAPISACTLRVIGVHFLPMHFPSSALSNLSLLMPMDRAMPANFSVVLLMKTFAASKASRNPGVSHWMESCTSCIDMPDASTAIAASTSAEIFRPSRKSWRPASAVKLPIWAPNLNWGFKATPLLPRDSAPTLSSQPRLGLVTVVLA